MKTPEPIPNITEDFLAHLLSVKIERNARGCILSTRSTNSNGAPITRLDRASLAMNPGLDKAKQFTIRRLVFKNSRHNKARDLRPHERVICSCGNERCINIAHLDVTTLSDIAKKGKKKGPSNRRKYPKITGNTQLINRIAMDLAIGYTIQEVQQRNNVSIHDIMDVRNGEHDDHIDTSTPEKVEKAGFDWEIAKANFKRKARQWISPAKRREIALDDTLRYSDLAKKYQVSQGTVTRIKADYAKGLIK